ncbi:MAG: TIGR03067 domain-containing protein [Planctomycetales bacterium]|nr:TIGR03067 domain-containing protein [Planctomycetales bacterium]
MRLSNPLSFILLAGIACCVSALVADDAKPKEEAKDDVKILEGSWNGIALEADGKKVPAEVLEKLKGRFTFKGLELLMTDTTPISGAKATVKLDSGKTPKQIDLTGIEGAGKGKTTQGIYKFEKDRLFICLRGPEFAEKGRPTEFKTEAGSGLGLMTLERVKE